MLIIIIALTFSACALEKNDYEEDLTMIKVVLYRGPTEIYLFELKMDGMLNVLSGNRYINDFTNPRNIDIVKSNSILLSEDQLLFFNQKIELTQNSEFSGGFVRGAWNVKILLGDEMYHFSYGSLNNENFNKLVTMFIEMSPIEIVDRVGRAVRPIIIN